MEKPKTPAQVAKMFGCTEEQARERIACNAKQLRADAEKARASERGKLRGLTGDWYAERASAFEAVL